MDFFSNYVNLIPVSLSQGAIYGFVALAVMIPFRILSLPDLTSKGTFPLGGVAAAALLAAGHEPLVAMLAAIVCGMLAGSATAVTHLLLKIPSLLAGIIILTMLFSVKIRVMGKPSTTIFDNETAFNLLLWSDGGAPLSQFALVIAVILLPATALYWFLHTEIGVTLRSVGTNQTMSRAQGLATGCYVVGGLALAGAFSATGGAVMAQYQSYADVNMGVGGLASTILGEVIVGRSTLRRQILAPILGALAYFQVIAMALGFNPSDLKLLTDPFVLATVAAPVVMERYRQSTRP